jgi:hypothetical protein
MQTEHKITGLLPRVLIKSILLFCAIFLQLQSLCHTPLPPWFGVAFFVDSFWEVCAILRCYKISSQNMQCKRERIRQKSKVKNLPKQFGAGNPRNGLCSFEQQEAILIRFWDNKLQFWPERLHILNKWGQNTLFLCFSVIIWKADIFANALSIWQPFGPCTRQCTFLAKECLTSEGNMGFCCTNRKMPTLKWQSHKTDNIWRIYNIEWVPSVLIMYMHTAGVLRFLITKLIHFWVKIV